MGTARRWSSGRTGGAGDASTHPVTVGGAVDRERVDEVVVADPRMRGLITDLLDLAPRGLAESFLPNEATFAHTVRRVDPKSPEPVRAEGVNRRYAAISALGIHHLSEDVQRQILQGRTASDLAAVTLHASAPAADPGAVALAAWAAAETGAGQDDTVTRRLVAAAKGSTALPTVDTAWTVAALLAMNDETSRAAADVAATRLKSAQRSSGLFPHVLPEQSASRLRRHVGCFADQVYPIQALARHYAATGDHDSLRAANACATRLCELQGSAGQWWWHYDIRTGSVVEGYPVYSVHQHAMAPMALMDLHEAGGLDSSAAIATGLAWLTDRPEWSGDLVAIDHGLVWRSVRRREPRHASRSLRAVTTSIHPAFRAGWLDRVAPPARVDYECRPYELGWLLYAWLSAGVVRRISHDVPPKAEADEDS